MNIKIITKNKKARFDYKILDTYEAGMELRGSEIKSIRAQNISIQQAYVQTDGEEIWLIDAYIHPYEQGGEYYNHDPKRRRKLLLHKQEIRKLWDGVRIKGHTIVPLKVYLKNGIAKIEIALAKGKSHGDKRHDIAERDANRQADREMSRFGF
ncbi:MAG: SsrA-binding protein [Anaerolinea sp. 4484_236]|nr:MAG: SsrA-binding protein [Anaerolinea sp. 4484_236]RLD10668.1 MAG: SsrA-binding protein [Chloroflexota bacterium]